jgi:hypothetical protein
LRHELFELDIVSGLNGTTNGDRIAALRELKRHGWRSLENASKQRQRRPE